MSHHQNSGNNYSNNHNNNNNNNSNNNNNNSSNNNNNKRKVKPCFAFERNGHCVKGKCCPFSHANSETRPSVSQGSKDSQRGPWMPPGADQHPNKACFGRSFDPHFIVPRRLAKKSADLVGAVNDFHYAMVNDVDRNDFYRASLANVVGPGSRVLEIGTGSGLLAMLAAQLGADWIVAVEANKDMAELARLNIQTNNLTSKITVLSKLSTELKRSDFPSPPNVLVSELLGTLLMGESALDYIFDARQRLLAPEAKIVPQCGCQFASLIQCKDLEAITSVKEWGGLNLSQLNILQDTASVVFTKQYGFRFSTVPFQNVVAEIPILEADFSRTEPGQMPRKKNFFHHICHNWNCTRCNAILGSIR